MLIILDAIDLMGRIAAAKRRRAADVLRSFGMSLPQYSLITLARRRGPISPSAAAMELGYDRPTIAVVLRNCVHAGWLARSRSSSDRRSRRLELTGVGEEILDRIEAGRPFAASNFGDPLDILDGEERLAMVQNLERILRRASDIWGPPANKKS